MKYCLIFILLLATTISPADFYPTIKVFRSGGLFDSQAALLAGANFFGRTHDAILSGNGRRYAGNIGWFDSLKYYAAINGNTIEVYSYTNLHYTQICGDSLTDTSGNAFNTDWYVTNMITDTVPSAVRESLYAHYGDSLIVQSLDGTGAGGSCPNQPSRTTIITADGTWDHTTRFSHDFWAVDSSIVQNGYVWQLNLAYSKIQYIRKLAHYEMATNHAKWLAFDSAIDGYYCDNSRYGNDNAFDYWNLDSSIDGSGGSWSSLASQVDWLELAKPHGTGHQTNWDNYTDLVEAVGDTLLDNGMRIISNFTNTAASRLDDLILDGDGNVVSDAFFETRLKDLVIGDWADIQGDLQRMDTVRNHPKCRNYWNYRAFGSDPDDTGYSHAGHSCFAIICVIQDTNTYMLFYGSGNGTHDTLYMQNYEIMQIDLGDFVADTYIVIDTGTTALTNNGIHFLIREYDSGWAGWITQNQSSATVNGATNASPIVITTSASHGWVTGEAIRISGVGGNEAANGHWAITVVDADEFSLDESTGDGAYTSGGSITNADSASTNYYTYDLGDSLYVIGDGVNAGHMDSTFKSDGVITLSPGKGVIAIRAQASAPAPSGQRLRRIRK